MAEAIKGMNQQYTNVIANNDGSTAIMAGAGFVGSLYVTKAGSADWAITVYDGTVATGTKIINAWTNPSIGTEIKLDCQVTTSLTIVTTSSSHGELLVKYRQFNI